MQTTKSRALDEIMIDEELLALGSWSYIQDKLDLSQLPLNIFVQCVNVLLENWP
jgi:hypothetical protein